MTEREKLIEILRTSCAVGKDCSRNCIECTADHLLANGVRLEPKQATSDENKRWIPVSERLPFAEYGESDDVFTVSELGVMRVLYFDGGCWCYQTGECCPHKVTHWMPLPEPPKEDESVKC
jgi:hypothetical protein